MEFLPGIHLIPGVLWSRIYLLEDDAMTLVDSGMQGNAGRVERYIRSIGRDPADVAHLLFTHSHPDHTGSALSLAKRTRGSIAAHPGDTRVHRDGEVTLSYMGAFTSMRLPLPYLQRVPVSRLVEDGDVLSIQGGLRVIHTPGHTPGSVCYLVERSGVLISGDTLFSDGKRVSRSVPFPGSNEHDYRASVDRLAALDFDTLCGGHGTPLIGGASDVLRDLVASRPDPPSWGGFFRSLPGRLVRARGL